MKRKLYILSNSFRQNEPDLLSVKSPIVQRLNITTLRSTTVFIKLAQSFQAFENLTEILR